MVKKEVQKMLRLQGAKIRIGKLSKYDNLPNTRDIGQENKKVRNTNRKV